INASSGLISWYPLLSQVNPLPYPVRIVISDGLRSDSSSYLVTVVAPARLPPQCSDGIDNDGDGNIDMNDPGCASVDDNDEYNAPPAPPAPPGEVLGEEKTRATTPPTLTLKEYKPPLLLSFLASLGSLCGISGLWFLLAILLLLLAILYLLQKNRKLRAELSYGKERPETSEGPIVIPLAAPKGASP
ncbi:MAG: hypothetical protein AAB935_00225, partial [Patescibacteria group bacterium]